MSGNPASENARINPIDSREELGMSAKREIERTLSSDQERAYLAQKLREAREYLGLSQEYVSQQTKMTRPAISEAEAGRRKVESLELRRLANLYGRPLDYFLPVQNGADVDRSVVGVSERMEGDKTEIKLRNLTRDLPSEDREEIIRFAEYLRHKKQASQTRRGVAAR